MSSRRNEKNRKDLLVDKNKYDLEVEDGKRIWRFRGSLALVLAGIVGLSWATGVSAKETPGMFVLCLLVIAVFGVIHLYSQRE